MSYIQGQDRDQLTLFPKCIDDYIPEDSIVRFIDKYVDDLDMVETGFTRAIPNPHGRHPYNPKDLLKLYIYGYFHKVRSSRRLERETHINTEVIWLMKDLKPDFKTIADFRKDNAQALIAVFRDFLFLAEQVNLLGKTFVAIDGTKIRAQNSKRKCYTQNQLAKRIIELDKSTRQYMKTLDSIDKDEESAPLMVKNIQEKIDELDKKKRIS